MCPAALISILSRLKVLLIMHYINGAVIPSKNVKSIMISLIFCLKSFSGLNILEQDLHTGSTK